jgi:choline dehydrogenase
MARDYDGWERGGAKGWGFKDVLRTYKAQEDWEGGANEWRGTGGPVHIRKPGDPHPTAPAFIEAARQMGFAVHDDANGPMREGAGYINMNIAADGTRVSSSRAFLRPNLDRPNLTLLLDSNVTKVTFEGDRATGVEIATADGTKKVGATREVILSAGSIHSARLLMLSGVGDAKQLRKLGIKPVADRRGVGANLQDHVIVSGVVYQYKGKMPDRPADSNAVEAEVYCRAESTPMRPTSISFWSSFRLRRRRRLPASEHPRRKDSRLRRRSFSRPAADASGSRARIGAMLPSSKAITWAPTAT